MRIILGLWSKCARWRFRLSVNAFDFSWMAVRAFELMLKYRSVPMDYADACLVTLSEQHANLPILTVDSGFQIYRRHGTQIIKLRAPFIV